MFIAGVDEAGRGPIAGPVTAAAVILEPFTRIKGLRDSKSLSVKKREYLSKRIKEYSICWNIVSIESKRIDSMNILQASLLAMKEAVLGLEKKPDKVLFDGLFSPDISILSSAIIKGDSKRKSIMAASIIAKVARDKLMVEIDNKYPDYGFKQHKGYPTKLHINKLKLFGPCEEHRTTFKPVSILINKEIRWQ